eukprot:8294166-Ditylum_brightwellii.AAC.1
MARSHTGVESALVGTTLTLPRKKETSLDMFAVTRHLQALTSPKSDTVLVLTAADQIKQEDKKTPGKN